MNPEGTYFAWLDFSQVISDHDLLRQIMIKKAKIALYSRFIFKKGDENFQRINFACPRQTLEKVLIAIKNVFE
jgi:cystathionine beta-lyase